MSEAGSFCGNCGVKFENASKFCSNCGEQVSKNSSNLNIDREISPEALERTKQEQGKMVRYILIGVVLFILILLGLNSGGPVNKCIRDNLNAAKANGLVGYANSEAELKETIKMLCEAQYGN